MTGQTLNFRPESPCTRSKSQARLEKASFVWAQNTMGIKYWLFVRELRPKWNHDGSSSFLPLFLDNYNGATTILGWTRKGNERVSLFQARDCSAENSGELGMHHVIKMDRRYFRVAQIHMLVTNWELQLNLCLSALVAHLFKKSSCFVCGEWSSISDKLWQFRRHQPTTRRRCRGSILMKSSTKPMKGLS